MAELGKRMNYKLDKIFHISKVWEDNTRTQNLANSKGTLVTSRTKYIGITYCFFRLMIKPNEIEILCIDTKIQRAYMFTKNSTRFNFEQIYDKWVGKQPDIQTINGEQNDLTQENSIESKFRVK